MDTPGEQPRTRASSTRGARVVRARPRVTERIARIWQYRELLVSMVRTELKVRYKNSALGFAWSLLNPLLYLVVFYVAFDLILGAGIPTFPIYLLSGLLVWNLFSAGLGNATSSVVNNAGLVNKVAFPREILPLAAIGGALVHFFLQGLVLATVLLVTRWDVALAYLPLIPLALVALLVLTAGLGILLSAINVYLRDTQHFLELALLAWFWMTPIVYTFMTLGNRGGWTTKLFMANPVTPVVLVFQRSLYAKLDTGANTGSSSALRNVATTTDILPDWSWGHYAAYLGYTAGIGIVLLTIAIVVFGRLEANFAEEL
jgi:ABC-type polysaccharide/polyol phosphate export permease